MTQIDDKVC